MNMVLLHESDFITPSRVKISGRRHAHIVKVLCAAKGDTLRVGRINHKKGTGDIREINGSYLEMDVTLGENPPAALPLSLVLALPRPKMFKRMLGVLTSLGVKKIYLINAWRVEKHFWKSPALEKDRMMHQIILGLEQAGDTLMPEIIVKRFFTPFVRDELPEIADDKLCLTAHPRSEFSCPRDVKTDTMLALGPEGGFIDIEIASLEEAGFKSVSLGERILRTETALPVLISRLF